MKLEDLEKVEIKGYSIPEGAISDSSYARYVLMKAHERLNKDLRGYMGELRDVNSKLHDLESWAEACLKRMRELEEHIDSMI